MPKRKTSPCRNGGPVKLNITLSSLDAALDMLATDTFTRLDSLISKFEHAAGIQVDPNQAKKRWEEAVKRYWVMRSMEVLTCSAYVDKGKGKAKCEDGDAMMDAEEEEKDENGRVIPKPHLGPVPLYGLCPDEEQQWRRWSPKAGDVVLVDLPEHGVWPGKIIDKKYFYQGRSVPKGNHYFPVRIYDEGIDQCVTVKSRLLPFTLRPTPPLLASPALQSAYHHANAPAGYDALAHARELNAAHSRSHPGVGGDAAELKREKEKWNEQVNWVMNERRAEKMRYLAEEREKRLASITVSAVKIENGDSGGVGWDDIGGGGGGGGKKRRTSIPLPDIKKSSEALPNNSIFGPMTTVPTPFPATSLPRRTASPGVVGGIIRPGLTSTPGRPLSPRRLEKRRSVHSGLGDHSPSRTRGTWTPPHILPSGDETAPGVRADSPMVRDGSSPVPTGKFDFVSPLGPVNGGTLRAKLGMTAMSVDGDKGIHRSGSFNGVGSLGELEVVKEEEGEAEEGWTLVGGKKKRAGRAGSAPCPESKGVGESGGGQGMEEEDMEL